MQPDLISSSLKIMIGGKTPGAYVFVQFRKSLLYTGANSFIGHTEMQTDLLRFFPNPIPGT
jgi:hypothetical protein